LLSIIIPTRDNADILEVCVNSILDKTTYPNYEIIVIDNGSVEKATLKLFSSWPKDKIRVIRDESPFNFSAINNRAAKSARGELICLMNNDIEIITPDWAEEMASFATMDEVGSVGARLWYPDGRLQHGGVIIGLGGVAGHAHKYIGKSEYGYFARAILHQSMSAVTAACLMVRRTVYEAVDGLDEELSIAFNDIDFCLRLREAGYRNIWTPYAEMIHHESISRGTEDDEEKQARFNGEIRFMEKRWGDKLATDPAYNPNLTIDREDFSLASPPRVS
jgi:GT2 family glycosyltransferase